MEFQEELCKLHEWSMMWQMKFTADKCKLMHSGTTTTKNPNFRFGLMGCELGDTERER